jgi:hypothetical protein
VDEKNFSPHINNRANRKHRTNKPPVEKAPSPYCLKKISIDIRGWLGSFADGKKFITCRRSLAAMIRSRMRRGVFSQDQGLGSEEIFFRLSKDSYYPLVQ